jgi:hypothetical protein
VLTLIQRGGSARSFHVEGTRIADLAPVIRSNIDKQSTLMTDEGNLVQVRLAASSPVTTR